MLGLTFKPNTDDMRDSASLTIIPALQRAGASIRAFDPEGMEEAKKLLDGVAFCGGAYEAMEGADAVVIVTEWNEFRALDLKRVHDAAALADGDRPAQHLQAGRYGRSRLLLFQHRPSLGGAGAGGARVKAKR